MVNDDSSGTIPGRPSKGQLKRETQALRELVEQLVALPPAVLMQLSLDETLREAVLAAKTFERGARARQLRYITGLLRGVDAGAVARAVTALAQPHHAEVRTLHQVEQWRDALLAGDDAVLEDLGTRFPAADHRRLSQLVQDARAERTRHQAPKSARLLFKFLARLLADAGQDGGI